MWRLKLTVVTVVVLGALIFGAAVAFAGWGWNAEVNVDGTVISTAWTVTEDEDGLNDYEAKIKITLPEGVDVSGIVVAPTETVRVRYDDDLECTSEGIEATVDYKVKHVGDGDGGEDVVVTVSVKGGAELGMESGDLGETISVDVLIPGSCYNYEGDDDDDDDDDEDEDEDEDGDDDE